MSSFCSTRSRRSTDKGKGEGNKHSASKGSSSRNNSMGGGPNDIILSSTEGYLGEHQGGSSTAGGANDISISSTKGTAGESHGSSIIARSMKRHTTSSTEGGPNGGISCGDQSSRSGATSSSQGKQGEQTATTVVSGTSKAGAACQPAVTAWPADASTVAITCQYTVPCGLSFAYVGSTLCFLHSSSGKLYPLQANKAIPRTGFHAQLAGSQRDPGGTAVSSNVTSDRHRRLQALLQALGKVITSAEAERSQAAGQPTHSAGQFSCSSAAENLHSAHSTAGPNSSRASRDDSRAFSGSKAPGEGCVLAPGAWSSLYDLPDAILELIGRHLLPEDASADDQLDTAYAAAALSCCGSKATLIMAQGAWGVLDPGSLDVASWVTALDAAVAQGAVLQAAPKRRMVLPKRSKLRSEAASELCITCHRGLEALSQLANPLTCPVRSSQRWSIVHHRNADTAITESVMRFGLSLEELVQVDARCGCTHRRGAVRRASMAKHGLEKFQELQAQPHAHASHYEVRDLEDRYRPLAVTSLLAQHNLTIDSLPDAYDIQSSVVQWLAREWIYDNKTPVQVVHEVVPKCERWQTLTAALQSRGCTLRRDSRLCASYIKHGCGNPDSIAVTMEEMVFFYSHTTYKDWLPIRYNNSEAAKQSALIDFVKGFASPSEAAEAVSVPESLRDKIRRVKVPDASQKPVRNQPKGFTTGIIDRKAFRDLRQRSNGRW